MINVEEKIATQPILSICIPSHNRVDLVLDTVRELMAVEDDRFNIVISDTSDQEEHLAMLNDLESFPRVRLFKNPPDTPPVKNWLFSLLHADGLFILLLLDRDKIAPPSAVSPLIDFLSDNTDCLGGLARGAWEQPEDSIVFENIRDKIMNLPYLMTHPSGAVFRTDAFKKVADSRNKTKNYFHGYLQDNVLGDLAVRGKLFRYNQPLWTQPSGEFFLKNHSGTGSRMSATHKIHTFSAEARSEVAAMFVELLKKLPIPSELKQEKRDQIVERGLWFSTFRYFRALRDENLAFHFDYEMKFLTLQEQFDIAQNALKLFKKKVGMSDAEYKKLNAWIHSNGPYIIDPEVEKAAKAGTA